MNGRGVNRLVIWLVAWLLVALLVTVSAQDNDGYSREQMLLFGTQHLENIDSPGVLYYDFHQSGPINRAIEDRVTLAVTRVNESGSKDLSTVFLSGDNRREFGDIPGFHSNPLIMYFLQWDAEKMAASSGVSHHYYRHLLRSAMRSGARSEEVVIDHGGRKLQGHRVFFEPLTGNKGQEEYGGRVTKRYEFILTGAIPGYVYSISTLVPGEKSGDEPLGYTRLTFNRLESAETKQQ